MTESTLDSDDLCRLISDLYGRSGVEEAIDECREFMEEDCPELLELLDAALERGFGL